MPPLKLRVAIAGFPYNGGASAAEHPDVKDWTIRALNACDNDPRVSESCWFDINDTPITMSRNMAVLRARTFEADVLVMVDSDQSPDVEYRAGDPTAKPFWNSSFDFLYNHWNKGPCVIGAPYCGPPPHENIYCFFWQNIASHHPEGHVDYGLQQYTRDQAARFTGISPIAALPTGLIMFDMRAFELTEPSTDKDTPWFYYEWEDKYCANKASTEDVTATRDISLAGVAKLGYNPIYCNWDSWVGHWKPKNVRKPVPITADLVGKSLKCAYERGVKSTDRITQVKSDIADTIDWPAMDGEVELLPSPDLGVPLEVLKQKLDWLVETRNDGNMPPADQRAIIDAMVELRSTTAEGAVVEVGCNVGLTSVLIWRLMLHVLDHDSTFHVYDSFDGLPALTEQDLGSNPIVRRGILKAQRQGLELNFLTRGLKCPEIHEGWFADTLPTQLPEQIKFALLDGDLYESIKVSLEHVWSRMSPDGVILIHDYNCPGIPGCKRAVDEFFAPLGIDVNHATGSSFCKVIKPNLATLNAHGNGHLQGTIA